MKKPWHYDTEKAAVRGEWETLEPGGYVCKIIKVEDGVSKRQKPMLTLFFDIFEGESKGFYRRQHEQSKQYREDVKWQGVYYQLYDDDQTKYFKGVIQSLEESNAFTFDFDEQKLVGKLFGGIFGREEYETTKGERRFSTKLTFIRTVETIKKGNFEIPKDKLLKEKQTHFMGSPSLGDSDFVLMNDDDDDIPF